MFKDINIYLISPSSTERDENFIFTLNAKLYVLREFNVWGCREGPCP